MASLDVVAHEYGHAISDLKLGMSYDENTITAILQEGISDIWGVILENAISQLSEVTTLSSHSKY